MISPENLALRVLQTNATDSSERAWNELRVGVTIAVIALPFAVIGSKYLLECLYGQPHADIDQMVGSLNWIGGGTAFLNGMYQSTRGTLNLYAASRMTRAIGSVRVPEIGSGRTRP